MAITILEKYNDYLEEHISNVKKGYEWLVKNDIIDINQATNAYHNVYEHDQSKYSPSEWLEYANYFYGEQTEKVKERFDYAWLHHIHNNPHHWQYWVLINDDDGTKVLDIPEEYIIEMICDWWAFSWKSGNLYEIFDWYDDHKDKMIISNNSKTIVEDLLHKIYTKLEELNI